MGTVAIGNIAEVTNKIGEKSYSFVFIPNHLKPNSIFNLIVKNKGEYNTSIVEYRMTPAFAKAYLNGEKEFNQFKGNINMFPFQYNKNFNTKF